MSDSDEEPEIIYVPGAQNHYKPGHNVVVLDARLKDFPLAHEEIKAHEIGHADPENCGLISHAVYEFKTDWHTYFGSGETAQELREYLGTPPRNKRSTLALLQHGVADNFRVWWAAAMRAVAPLYRRFVSGGGA